MPLSLDQYCPCGILRESYLKESIVMDKTNLVTWIGGLIAFIGALAPAIFGLIATFQ